LLATRLAEGNNAKFSQGNYLINAPTAYEVTFARLYSYVYKCLFLATLIPSRISVVCLALEGLGESCTAVPSASSSFSSSVRSTYLLAVRIKEDKNERVALATATKYSARLDSERGR
jgi:hypothetical protein